MTSNLATLPLARKRMAMKSRPSGYETDELESAFGGIAQIKEEYLELQREIYR